MRSPRLVDGAEYGLIPDLLGIVGPGGGLGVGEKSSPQQVGAPEASCATLAGECRSPVRNATTRRNNNLGTGFRSRQKQHHAEP